MKLRTGRHNDRIVYLQDTDEPTKQDPMVATFFSARRARLFVDLANYIDDPNWWDEFARGTDD